MLRTQVLAWDCGSIIRGQRVEFLRIMALSIEKESFGSFYWFVHTPIVSGSQSTSYSVNAGEVEIVKRYSISAQALIDSSR